MLLLLLLLLVLDVVCGRALDVDNRLLISSRKGLLLSGASRLLLLLVLVSLEEELELFWYLGDTGRLGVGEVDRVCWCGWSNKGEEEGVEEGLTPTNRGGITGGTCW